jgi:hypothetical protein
MVGPGKADQLFIQFYSSPEVLPQTINEIVSGNEFSQSTLQKTYHV